MADNDPKRANPPAVPQGRPSQPPPQSAMASFGSALGTVAIAVGIGVLGAYMLDLHAHRCDACGHRWRHLGAFNVGDPESHTCGKCGVVQWWKDGVPHVFRSSLYKTPTGASPPRTLISPMQEIRGVRSLALPSGASTATPRRELATTTEHETYPTRRASGTKENQS